MHSYYKTLDMSKLRHLTSRIPRCRKEAIGIFAGSALMFSIAAPGHAQLWTGGGSFKPVGTATSDTSVTNPFMGGTVTSYTNSTAITSPVDLATAYPSSNEIGIRFDRNGLAGSGLAEAANAKIRFRMTGGPANQTRTVKLLVEAYAYALSSTWGWGSTDSTAKVTFHDSDLSTFTPLANTSLAPGQWGNGGVYRTGRQNTFALQGRNVTRSVTFDANGVGEVDINFSIKCSAEVVNTAVPPQMAGQGDNWAHAFVRVSQKFITQSRQGGSGDYTDGFGITHGDTIYSHLYGDPLAAVMPVDNWQEINPTYRGSWSGNVSAFTWSPAGGTLLYPDTKDRSWQLMEQGTLHQHSNGNWYGTPTGTKQVAVSLSATDAADGKSASGTFMLHLHDPIEKANETVTNVWAEQPLWGSAPTPTNPNGLASFVGGTNTSIEVSEGHGSASGWSFTAGAEAGLEIAKVIDVLSAGASVTWSTENTHEVSTTYTYGNLSDPGLQVYPILRSTFNRYTYYFRHFTPSGQHWVYPNGQGPPEEFHKSVYDTSTGATVVWSSPMPVTSPLPQYSPTTPPIQPAHP